MTGWHVDPPTLARYAGGAGRQAADASVEAHLLACAGCRAALRPAVQPDRLARLWEEVARRVDDPRPGPLERLLRRLGVAQDTARLLAATPALRASWLAATAAALAFAVAAGALGGHQRGTLLFLALAPVLPVAGVAAAFHRGLDPTHDIAVAAPYPLFRLLLLRSATVVGLTCAGTLAAGALLPQRALTAAAWLLPALALTTLTLALAGRLGVGPAAAGVSTAWLAAVAATGLGAGGLDSGGLGAGWLTAFGVAGQLGCLAVATLSSLVVLAHRDRYATLLGGAR